MGFAVIPGLDVAGGRLVRITGSTAERSEAFGADPLAAAEVFAALGATRLHFVDVDMASSGRGANLEVLRRIAGLGVPVQASGGIRSQRGVREALDAGADRVVIGSRALTDHTLVASLVAEHRDQLVFGLEVQDGDIHPRGSEGIVLPLADSAAWLSGLGASRFLVTALTRVGSLDGPDLDGLSRVLEAGVPVLAAGGIATIDHLRSISAAGAEGAVVGRAALEGSIDMRSLLAGAV